MTRRLWLATFLTLTLACGAPAQEIVSPGPPVDRDALLQDLQHLSADAMEGRLAGSEAGARARAYVAERFREVGVQPIGDSFEMPFTFSRRGDDETRLTGANVVGVVRGTTRPDRYIVVSAHYDHIGVRNGEVFNGADDNASGTAALFAVGRYLSQHAPAHSVILAAMDAEEGGLRGARAFVAEPPVPLASIVLNLNLDMIARDPDNTLYAVGTYHYPALKPYLERVAAAASITLRFGHDNPNEAGVEDWTRSSDHAAFHAEQIPFIYFGVEDFAQHHKSTDDYETITPDFYVRAVETIIQATMAFDENLDAVVAASHGTRPGGGTS